MADYFRPDIANLPAYVAGRNPEDPEVIKVASNEMPFPTLPGVTAALGLHLSELNRYPDMGAVALKEAIAAFHNTSVANVAVGNGSVALIEQFLQAVCVPGAEVVIPWRSFEAYPIAIQVAGGKAVKVGLRNNGKIDLPAMLDAITARTRAILICTPNNPTSCALTHEELRRFLRSVPSQIPVLVDEAYVDFVEMNDAVRGVELAAEFANVISLRTFSKAYALAGLRVGYALGMENLVEGLDKVATPFRGEHTRPGGGRGGASGARRGGAPGGGDQGRTIQTGWRLAGAWVGGLSAGQFPVVRSRRGIGALCALVRAGEARCAHVHRGCAGEHGPRGVLAARAGLPQLPVLASRCARPCWPLRCRPNLCDIGLFVALTPENRGETQRLGTRRTTRAR
ncbi:aminotransferase class I/II-fold pyridoxal phosphate-dependent enzyme [Trueperella pyogenes]|uniref:aminotransferase class I/II-fold pyridoxal phosphate-dependent enzyme n=1 Tax=Trueperella pyogenes TaxID=1661 RepID=UPI003F532711